MDHFQIPATEHVEGVTNMGPSSSGGDRIFQGMLKATPPESERASTSSKVGIEAVEVEGCRSKQTRHTCKEINDDVGIFEIFLAVMYWPQKIHCVHTTYR